MTAVVSPARAAAHRGQKADVRAAVEHLDRALESRGLTGKARDHVQEAAAYLVNVYRLIITEPNPADYRHERVQPPARFDKRSFRTLARGDHAVIVGCPAGHWKGGQCAVPMEVQAVLHPKGERQCANPTLAVIGNPDASHARLLGTEVHRIEYRHATAGLRYHDFEYPDQVRLYVLNPYQVLIQGVDKTGL